MYSLENIFEGKEAKVSTESMSTDDCETPNIETLNHENEEEVSGGYIYKCNNHPDYKYEVISNKSGNVVGRFATEKEARNAIKEYNKSLGGNPCQITDDYIWRYNTLQKIREENARGERKYLGEIGDE